MLHVFNATKLPGTYGFPVLRDHLSVSKSSALYGHAIAQEPGADGQVDPRGQGRSHQVDQKTDASRNAGDQHAQYSEGGGWVTRPGCSSVKAIRSLSVVIASSEDRRHHVKEERPPTKAARGLYEWCWHVRERTLRGGLRNRRRGIHRYPAGGRRCSLGNCAAARDHEAREDVVGPQQRITVCRRDSRQASERSPGHSPGAISPVTEKNGAPGQSARPGWSAARSRCRFQTSSSPGVKPLRNFGPPATWFRWSAAR